MTRPTTPSGKSMVEILDEAHEDFIYQIFAVYFQGATTDVTTAKEPPGQRPGDRGCGP